MDTLWQDLTHGVRRLWRAPGFTIVAVATLALGIGANTAIFGLVNALLLRPPAHVAEPERLVMLYTSDFSGPAYGSSSYADFLDFREATDVFEGITLFRPGIVGIGAGDALERTGAELVTADYFRVLGTPMRLGRSFLDEEGEVGAEPVAVISYALWQRRFGGDPGIVGRAIDLNGRRVTVVGVAPERFAGRFPGFVVDVWVPFAQGPALGLASADALTSRGDRGVQVIARLRPGVTLEAAQERMRVVARRLHAAYPDAWTDVNDQGRRITLLSESEARLPPQIKLPVLGILGLLGAVVGIVLLICCANLAGLLLARASGRRREIAIRASLGAGRRRLVRQLLTESAVLATVGAALGLLLATWATDLLLAAELPVPVRLEFDLSPDGRVLGFTALVAAAATLAFGLAPALRVSGVAPGETLRSESMAATGGRRRLTLQNALVVAQVALSLVLVVGALLFVRTLQHTAGVDLGFRPDNLLLVSVEPPPGSAPGADADALGLEMRERVAALPGVVAATWADRVPLDLASGRRWVVVEGYEPRTGEDMEFHNMRVGPGYFETLGVPLLRGRGLEEADREGAPGAVVVNEAFARRFWPDGDALGRRIGISGSAGPVLEIVGVTTTGKYLSPVEEERPFIYFPALQVPGRGPFTLHVRTAGDPTSLASAVRREIAATAPGWIVTAVRTMDDQLGVALLPQRLAAGALGLFGTLALGLAALGLYGVVAYAVAQRTREFGIRIALGAEGNAILRMVLRQGAGLVGTGVAIGMAGTLAVARLLEGLLLGTSALDPLAFGGAAATLVGVALLASWVPARRAVRVDPVVALRGE